MITGLDFNSADEICIVGYFNDTLEMGSTTAVSYDEYYDGIVAVLSENGKLL